MTTAREKTKNIAVKLLKENPEGIRYSELARMISKSDGSLKVNSVGVEIATMHSRYPKLIYKPSYLLLFQN